MKTITITKTPNGRWGATTMSDNNNPLASVDDSRIKAIIRLEALLREEGFYGTVEIRDLDSDNNGGAE